MSNPDPEGLSPAHRRALLGLLLGVSLGALEAAIANTALPAIAADLQAAPAASIWVINAYQLAVVATLLPFAALGDRIGVRRVFLGGLAFFTAASLWCALAPSLALLVTGRALQGVGAGALMSVNIALIRLIYPASRLGRGVGLNALAVGLGFVSGPSIASLVLTVAPWPWLFAFNLPFGLLALASAWNTLPESTPRPHGFDPLVAGLTALGFASLVLGLGSAAQRVGGLRVAVPLLVAVVCAVIVLRRQRGHPAPMLPVDLLRRPLFALSAFTSTASFTTQGLAFVSLPFFFETVLHRPPVETGFLMLPWAVLVAVSAPVAGRLSERYPAGWLGGIGLVTLSAGMASLSLLAPGASGADIVWRMVLCGAGFGLFQSPNLNALMSSAPPERAGGASGVIAIARLLGQTTGAALVALCFGLAAGAGPTWALRLGACTAALAAVASFARLRVGRAKGVHLSGSHAQDRLS
jgi:MFS transporter, DHA2 family, multidrug resistance protein